MENSGHAVFPEESQGWGGGGGWGGGEGMVDIGLVIKDNCLHKIIPAGEKCFFFSGFFFQVFFNCLFYFIPDGKFGSRFPRRKPAATESRYPTLINDYSLVVYSVPCILCDYTSGFDAYSFTTGGYEIFNVRGTNLGECRPYTRRGAGGGCRGGGGGGGGGWPT